MKKIIGERASGGNGWADAMFRRNADTITYIEGMLERVLRKHNFKEGKYEVRYPLFSRFDYILLNSNRIIIKGTFSQVENHRRRSTFSYENWLKIIMETDMSHTERV